MACRFVQRTISLTVALLLIGCNAAKQAPVSERTNHADNEASTAEAAPAEVADGGLEATVRVRPEDLPTPMELTSDDWPQFRGANRDAIVRSSVRLARTWPTEGPPILWETAVGQGYSSPAVVGEKVFLNDYDEARNIWMVRCLALEDGKPLWTYEVSKRIRPNHSITRTSPATDGGFVFSIDPKCELHCLDARSGGLIWKKRLPEVYKSPIPPWYNGQCPLIDGNKLIVATGGSALLTALDKATGEPLWETPNPDGALMSHSSVMPIELDGERQYVYLTLTGCVGVSAATGDQLWSFPWKFNTAVSTSALDLGEGRLLLTSGYHAQSVICQVKQTEGVWSAEEVTAFAPPPQGWNSEVHTPIFHRGYIFGVGKNKRGMWTCLDLTGNEVWTSGRTANFGMGGYVLADGMFYVLDGKSGALRLLDAEADEYRQLAEAKLLSGPDVWAPPIISRGRLLVRDLGRLLCLDVAEHGAPLAAGGEANQLPKGAP